MSGSRRRGIIAWTLAVGYGALALGVFVAAVLGTPETSAGGVYLLLLAVPWSLLILLLFTVLDVGPSSVAFVLVSIGLLVNFGLLVSIARSQRRGGS